jgi:peptidoglycan/xylan/chitin deacetylase (PgdA/CDA1 family)
MNLFIKALTAGLIASIMGVEPPAESVQSKRSAPTPDLERGPKDVRRIALTFDADEGDEELPLLLRILENENVTATFFLTGRWASEFPASAARIVERGHVIGNHTWGHKDLTKLTDAEIQQELLRVDDKFASLFKCQYLPLFRAPTGEKEARILAVAEKLGFRTVRWSVDTLDATEPRKTASFIENRVLGRSDEDLCGAIVLMHVGNPETCAALPVIIHNLRERGFEFVPVSAWTSTAQARLPKVRTN